MRLLRFNNEEVDIDEKTSIGIDIQAYDVSNLSRRVNVSNSFSLPKTAKIMKQIGFAGNSQSTSKIVYDEFKADYWINSVKFVSGSSYVQSVTERINCYIYDKDDFFTLAKDYKFDELQVDYVNWLTSEHGFPSSILMGTFSSLVSKFNDYLKVPYFKSNLDPDNITLTLKTLPTADAPAGDGGHFACSISKFFEFIEWKFDVDLGLTRSFDSNIFEDAVFQKMLVPLRNITIDGTASACYLTSRECNFLPLSVKIYAKDKTLYDFLTSLFKYFNIIIDYEPYMLRRFDEIDNADVLELKNIQEDYDFYPKINGYTQNNYIMFSKIYTGGSPYINSKNLICKNKNIESAEKTITTIDAYISRVISSTDTAANLSTEDAFSTFCFLIETEQQSLKALDFNGTQINILTFNAEIYSLDSEYQKIAEILEYPKVYEIKKYFSFTEINNFKFFKRYFVRSLNGYFYVNKISGYNPEKTKSPVTLTLIKL